MSLATRCPACGTVFRVVLDQLRISEGWVRCGRCNGVFDAAEVLFDIDQGTPVQLDLSPALDADPKDDDQPAPARQSAAPATTATTATAARAAPPEAADPSDPADPADPPWTITDWVEPAPGQPLLAPPATGSPAQHRLATRIEPGFTAASRPPPSASCQAFDRPLLHKPSVDDDDEITISDADTQPGQDMAGPYSDGPPGAAPALAHGVLVHGVLAHGVLADSPLAAATPGFLRAAERAARWRRPLVRLGLAAAVGLLALAAGLQSALLGRDALAAQLPASAPALRALCRLLACQVQAPRRIDALTVDSSALGRLDGTGRYRLQVVLHNHANIPVMAPALELSLTDGQGKLALRRVLGLAELGGPAAALAAGQTVTLHANLSTGEQRIDGYSVELFYP